MSHTVLVPVDGSPLSFRALEHAIDTFDDSEIIVMHVTDLYEPWHGISEDDLEEVRFGSDEWYAMEEDATKALLAKAKEIATQHECEIDTKATTGDPERVIPDYAREEDIDHIVLGVHGREEAERTMFGRVAETVVFRSPVSVTIIR